MNRDTPTPTPGFGLLKAPLLCVFLLILAPTVALGQSPPEKQPKRPSKAKDGVELVKRTFKRLDVNKDGAVTLAEVQRAKISEGLFKRHDDDASSSLTTDEFAVLYKDLLVQAKRPVSKELQDEVTRIQARRRAKEAEERAAKEKVKTPPTPGPRVQPQGRVPNVIPEALKGPGKDVARKGQTPPLKDAEDPGAVQGSKPAGEPKKKDVDPIEGAESKAATPEETERRIREARIKQAGLDEQRIREARIKQAALDEQRIREARIKAANEAKGSPEPVADPGGEQAVGKVKSAGRRKPAKVTTRGRVKPIDPEPVGTKPDAIKPVSGTPVKAQPATDRPKAQKPGTKKPGTEKPGTEKPGAAKPADTKPVTIKPGTIKPGTIKPGTDKPGTDKPVR